MLLGYYSIKIDEKGRLAVPKHCRGEIGENLVIARWYEGCLLLINRKLWGGYLVRLTGGELATLAARDTDRFLLAGSFEVGLDKQGRFVVPPTLREYAKINDDVIIAGLGDKLEIWDKKSWEEREEMIIGQAGEKVERLYRERQGGQNAKK